jgi:hypothetical protein
MADHDRTWARLVQVARQLYPDDTNLIELRATEVFDEEQLAADSFQAEQLDREASKVEVAEAEAVGRVFTTMLERVEERERWAVAMV